MKSSERLLLLLLQNLTNISHHILVKNFTKPPEFLTQHIFVLMYCTVIFINIKKPSLNFEILLVHCEMNGLFTVASILSSLNITILVSFGVQSVVCFLFCLKSL